MRIIENFCLLLGRLLMGTYFILPGLRKISNYQGTTDYMLAHSVPAAELLLPVTIVIQILLGLAIIIGFKGKLSAFILAGLTLVISIYMHDFWTMAEGLARTHETQNFFKNMGIMAGLLMVSSIGTGWLSLDNRITHKP
ncbi:DoxX family protein [uncultured Paraglaciecola sp.]|jgi:putative oxidoreductase|uniref:DoxX family protein n=1 Tax=uncultured Paraglaciecola sp. TaxID=1765024 RepID=UPI00262228C6|nr:DoxX family protein [uncultured Paraglaciecola sp.]|tara:strand:+ start:396 stop:812 length:417 start_codon:yes stop_codon:yes gene_type:complete